MIAKFFKEIGRVDELGSGVRNTFKYCAFYTPGAKPEFVEDDVFKTVIPLTAKGGTQITTQINSERILELLRQNPALSRKKLAEALGDITEDGVKYHLEKLKEEGKIKRVGGTRGRWKVLDELLILNYFRLHSPLVPPIPYTTPFSVRYLSASKAAIQPVPAAVTAWR